MSSHIELKPKVDVKVLFSLIQAIAVLAHEEKCLGTSSGGMCVRHWRGSMERRSQSPTVMKQKAGAANATSSAAAEAAFLAWRRRAGKQK